MNSFGGYVDNPRAETQFIARLDEAALLRMSERLTALMADKQLSGRGLGRASGVPVNAVRQIIRAEHKPSIGKLIAVASALDVSLDALLGDGVPRRFAEEVRRATDEES